MTQLGVKVEGKVWGHGNMMYHDGQGGGSMEVESNEKRYLHRGGHYEAKLAKMRKCF